MNRTARHQQRGFTLAEILVTTAIFAIIMIAALTVYDRSNRIFKSGTESADMQQSTRIGFDKLVADLRMAGFDYNRGGTPTKNGEFPQPDEQIEYAGPTAVVFRANFNYNTASSTGNGLEPTYTPLDATNAPIFPFVTTSNDEIVAYVTRSADNTKNVGAISFYTDSSKPRKAYPGGQPESLLTISSALCATCGIDTTNANPPYTLYRMTVSDILNRVPGTPVAENIRSLNFFYYTDTNGATVLKNNDGPPATDITDTRNADGSTIPATAPVTILNSDGTTATSTIYTGAIGGAGQYDPAGPGVTANFADRQSRATIQSVRVNVIGMNANPEPSYTQPTESIARIKNYRQYPLSALIVPRNLGLTGFPEPSNSAPSVPVITGICTAHCAAPVICWTPPTGGGPVEQYRIEWDTVPTGSFPNSLIIADPTAVTAIISDNGIMDPSLTWYYRIFAQNDNGSSPAQNPTPAQPKNSTKPLPPAAGTITTGSAVPYAVTVNWVAPSNNDPAKATMTCTGTGCTTDPSTIPSQEIIKYRVYRGLTPTFDPNVAGSSAKVLAAATGVQPTSAGPGSPITWNDSPIMSAFPAGTCVPYYYRLQAVDRCFSSNNYNTSGDLNDSISALSPPVGTNAIPGQAVDVSTAKATAPLNLKVNGGNSACPAAASLNCQVDLSWAKVTNDTAGNAIGVDKYRLTRYRKKYLDPAFVLDTTFNGTGILDISGVSQSASGSAGKIDTTGVAIDTADGAPWYYEYTVTANDCRLGLVSNTADYPTLCAGTPSSISQTGATGGGSGDTIAQAWVMNAGDTIYVTPAAGLTIASVKYDVYAYPSGTVVDSQTTAVGPTFAYGWSDRTDLQIYQVRIGVTDTTGCTEVHVKYVQDQQAAPCAFVNRPLVGIGPTVTSGPTRSFFETYTVTNTGAETLNFSSKPIKVTWAIPAGFTVSHSDLTLDDLTYSLGGSDGGSGSLPGTVTRSIPAAALLTAGSSMTIRLHWTYKKNDDSPTPLAGQTLSKICLDYSILSEPGITKHCNLVGQSASTTNPTTCD